jgi:probable HAF family extracellular repeat protein
VITELGVLPGATSSQATDINNQGQVVGISGSRAFLWEKGGMADLGTLSGSTYSVAHAINNKGQVVGRSGDRAFLWQNGVVSELPMLRHSEEAEATGINDYGEIVGFNPIPSECGGAVMWSEGRIYCMGSLWGESHAIAINNENQLAGWSIDFEPEAVMWDGLPAPREPNSPPISVANGPYSGAEGAEITFSSAGSSDPEGQELHYRWDFGDGTTAFHPSPVKAFKDNGAYTVTLTVTDARGASVVSTTSAVIGNLAPTATAWFPSSINEGSGYKLSLKGFDRGPADRTTLEYAFDCGQGAGYRAWSKAASVNCPTVGDQRNLAVRAKVRDKDGGEAEYTKSIAVGNVKPVVTLNAFGPTSLVRGGTVSMQATFSDPGMRDGPWNWAMTWGDGSKSAGVVTSRNARISLSHPYAKAGRWLAYLRVTDKDGGVGTSAKITVTVAP